MTTRRTLMLLAGPCSWVLLLQGCGGLLDPSSPRSGRTLTPGDFAAAPSEPVTADSPAAPSGPTTTFPVVRPEQAREGIADVVALTGDPAPPATPATPASDPPAPAPVRSIAIDEVVGQINGAPVYASDFLRDMDARLAANAAKMKKPEWVRDTYKAISEKLRDQMRDELLLSEFNTSLKPEQKQGVLAFVTKVRDDLRSGSLGSETLATRRLLESEGKTINEKARDIADKAFINDQLRRMVYNRIQVSRREVERYYENNPQQFQPPAVARFRVIRVAKSDTAAISRVESALASGEDFAAVAARESDWNRRAERDPFTQAVEFRGAYTEAELFGGALNDAARALSPGQSTGRIDAGTGAFWLRLERIDAPPPVSLYEAQLAIEKKIRNERFREEQGRYFENLLRRSSASALDKMAEALTVFATDRYWGQSRVAQPGADPAAPPASPTP